MQRISSHENCLTSSAGPGRPGRHCESADRVRITPGGAIGFYYGYTGAGTDARTMKIRRPEPLHSTGFRAPADGPDPLASGDPQRYAFGATASPSRVRQTL